MKQSYIYIAIAVVLILTGLFVASMFIGNEEVAQQPQQENEQETERRPEVTITAKHQYKDGIHIIAGEIDMPTPCHILDWSVIGADDTPPPIYSIDFTLMSEAEVCAQVITPSRFKVEFEGQENAEIQATLNGDDVVLNLIEAGPDEDLEDFELFIKG